MDKHVVYTVGQEGYSDLWIFSRLDAVFGGRPPHTEIIFIGTEGTNEPFLAWAHANSISHRVHITRSDKFGYSALIKSVKKLFHDEIIKSLVVLSIDAQSMDITHVARNKQVRVLSL